MIFILNNHQYDGYFIYKKIKRCYYIFSLKRSDKMNEKDLSFIKKVLHIDKKDVLITSLKKGMTNDSYLLSFDDKKYIVRIPGEGSNNIINRKNEIDVYSLLKDKNISDNVIYIDDKGYKITEYIDNSRNCEPHSEKDLIRCMKVLRNFHNLNLKINKEFNLYDQIEFYESLLEKGSKYKDYNKVKNNVFSLKEYIDNNVYSKCLTHIDAVPDNFLICKNDIRLIDFEYAMDQDPHIDIAMFCIYSLYTKEEIDHLIDIYFENNCPLNIRIKIYCYIAVCGLLWSNWCEYKESFGIKFGDYAKTQYNYAKEYCKVAKEMIRKTNKIERAIILAAGKGTRLRPITYEIPKSLIEVNGKRMIDTIIDSLYKNGINEIYVVVGYLKEKFYVLKEKYPNVKFIENPYYDNTNSISSLYVARDYIENCIIMDADQIIYNDNILNPYFNMSGYSCSWSSRYTKEWLLTLDDNKVVSSCSKDGGKDAWRLYSLSRWNKKDGLKLKKYLEYEFENKKNRDIYWDDVVLFRHFDSFKLGIYQIKEEDMIEIDTIDELIMVDGRYKNER